MCVLERQSVLERGSDENKLRRGETLKHMGFFPAHIN